MGSEGRGHSHQNTGYLVVRVVYVASASLLYHSRYGTSTVRHLARYELEHYAVRSSHRMHLIIVLYDTAVVQRTSIYRTFIPYQYVHTGRFYRNRKPGIDIADG